MSTWWGIVASIGAGEAFALCALTRWPVSAAHRTRARWAYVHAFVNVLIAYSSRAAAVGVVSALAAARPTCRVAGAPPAPMPLMLCLHLWHVAAYRLTADDVMHHACFVLALGGTGSAFDFADCGAAALFFACGLPGAAGYLLGALRAQRHIAPRTERVGLAIATAAVRAPGMLAVAVALACSHARHEIGAPRALVALQVVGCTCNALWYAFTTVRRALP